MFGVSKLADPKYFGQLFLDARVHEIRLTKS